MIKASHYILPNLISCTLYACCRIAAAQFWALEKGATFHSLETSGHLPSS